MPSPSYQAAIQHMQAGRLDAAEQTLRRQLTKQPADVDAAGLLGAVLTQLGRFDQADFVFRRALAISPGNYQLLGNYGNLCLFAGRFADAKRHFEAGLAIVPDGLEILLGLGPTLYSLGEIDAAVAVGRRAMALAPHDPGCAVNLGASLTASGQIKEAAEVLKRALHSAPHKASLVSNYLGALNYDPDLSDEHVRSEHVRIARWLGGKRGEPAPRPAPPPVRAGAEAGPLRVGFVSADLRSHSVAWFIRAIVEHLDRARFTPCAYFHGTRDSVSESLRGVFLGGGGQGTPRGCWHDCLGVSDESLAQRIRDDRIDILFDLSGHTDGTRLSMFRHRPAPVQATYLGYPNTTGLPEMDYRLVDAHTDPVPAGAAATDAGGPATERYLRLERCFICYTPPPEAPDPGPPPLVAHGYATFICCNAVQKLNPTLFGLWGRIFARLPTARLIIKNNGFKSAGVLELMRTGLAAAGIEPSRVDLVSWAPTFADHLGCYARADIALDSIPYNGTTTTCEALWMGLPVVCLRGGTHAGRVGTSLLHAVGTPELLADTADEYVNLAVALARDAPRLAGYRSTLRARVRASPLCDGPGMARAFERASEAMWAERAGA